MIFWGVRLITERIWRRAFGIPPKFSITDELQILIEPLYEMVFKQD